MQSKSKSVAEALMANEAGQALMDALAENATTQTKMTGADLFASNEFERAHI